MAFASSRESSNVQLNLDDDDDDDDAPAPLIHGQNSDKRLEMSHTHTLTHSTWYGEHETRKGGNFARY